MSRCSGTGNPAPGVGLVSVLPPGAFIVVVVITEHFTSNVLTCLDASSSYFFFSQLEVIKVKLVMFFIQKPVMITLKPLFLVFVENRR